MRSKNKAIAAILISSFIFDFNNNVLKAVVSDLWTFSVTASAEGYLIVCTVFFIFVICSNLSVSAT